MNAPSDGGSGRNFGGPGGGPGGFGGGPGGGGRGNFGGPANNLTQVRDQIGASEEEWKVIGPKLAKVVSARAAVEASLDGVISNGFAGPGGFGGRGGGRGGNDSFGGPAGAGAFSGHGGRGGRGGFGGPNFGPPGSDNPQSATAPANDFRPGPPRGNNDRDSQNFTGGPGGPGNFDGPGGFGGGRGGRGGRGGFGGPPGMGGGGNAVTTALTALQTAAADEKTSPEELKAKVSAVRAARAKAQTDLDAAQKDLRLLLTPEQEAVLVAQGYLD
jgi:hypothetical protein